MAIRAHIRDSLRNRILEAFASRPYPSNVKIVNEAGDADLEAGRVAQFLEGRQWSDLQLSQILSAYIGDPSSLLGFLTAQGFAYYLPAFLIMCIEDYERADAIVDLLVHSITPPAKSESGHEWFGDLLAALGPEERRAVAQFLEFLRTEYHSDFLEGELERPLSHWRQYAH